MDFTWENQKKSFDALVRHLLQNDYKLTEIYEMDLFYFMNVMQEKEKEEAESRSLFSAFGK